MATIASALTGSVKYFKKVFGSFKELGACLILLTGLTLIIGMNAIAFLIHTALIPIKLCIPHKTTEPKTT